MPAFSFLNSFIGRVSSLSDEQFAWEWFCQTAEAIAIAISLHDASQSWPLGFGFGFGFLFLPISELSIIIQSTTLRILDIIHKRIELVARFLTVWRCCI